MDNGSTDRDSLDGEVNDINVDNAPIPLDADVLGIGESVIVGDTEWCRVNEMDAPERTNIRQFRLKNMEVTDNTTELDFFCLCCLFR